MMAVSCISPFLSLPLSPPFTHRLSLSLLLESADRKSKSPCVPNKKLTRAIYTTYTHSDRNSDHRVDYAGKYSVYICISTLIKPYKLALHM
jgi:hypothetical protein